MIQSCFFETPIAASYLRNNRSTKQKSLRCFPSCDPRGHIAAGFCGLPLRVRVVLTQQEGMSGDFGMEQLDQYIFIAQTRPTTQPGISSMKVISKQDIISNVRTKNDKNSSQKGELFVGDVGVVAFGRGAVELNVTFNLQHCSWDYSWKSNRWSGSQEMHLVDIILLSVLNPAEYLVLSSFQSTSFIIASSHKRPPSKASDPASSNLSDAEVLQASNLLTTLGHVGGVLGGKGRKSALRTEANAQLGSRDTEGAETLISLLGPLVKPQHYMYDLHSNKRVKVADDDAMAGTSSSDSDNSAPRHNNNAIILLPVRDIME